ncbi:MAG: oligosaccharide flippase family protein [Candidatus Hydrogenedentes bacterium]|nr:oligosaccharide flippase family protein [Candidatus Hydrogenedentota bacterium]
MSRDNGAFPRPDRNFAVMACSEGAQKALTLLLFMVLSRMLTVEENGVYGLFVSLFPLLVVLLNMGLSDIAVREIARAPEQTGRLIAAALAGQTLIGALLLAAVPVLWFLLPDGDPAVRWVLVATLPATLPFVWGRTVLSVFSGREHFGPVAVLQVALRAAVVAATLAVLFLGASVPVLVALLAPVHLVWALAVAAWARRHAVSPITAPGAVRPRWMLAEGAPVAVGGVIATLYFGMDLFLLRPFVDPEALGQYALAVRFLIMLLPLADLLGTVFYPVFSRKTLDAPDGAGGAFLRGCAAAMSLGVPMAAGTLLLARPVTVFLAGEKFLPAAPAVAALAASAALFLPACIGQMQLRARGMQGRAAVILGVAAALKAALVLGFAPGHGADAAVWANLAVGALLAAGLVLLAGRGMSARWPWLAAHTLRVVLSTALMAGALWPLREMPVPLTVPAGMAVFLAGMFVFAPLSRRFGGTPSW